MNAAGRLVHHGVLSRQLLLIRRLVQQQMMLALLAMAVIFSALGIIYVTHTSRLLQASYQHHLLERTRLHVEYSRLLLERSAWMMQARVQQFAQKKLGMVMPNAKSIVIVRE